MCNSATKPLPIRPTLTLFTINLRLARQAANQACLSRVRGSSRARCVPAAIPRLTAALMLGTYMSIVTKVTSAKAVQIGRVKNGERLPSDRTSPRRKAMAAMIIHGIQPGPMLISSIRNSGDFRRLLDRRERLEPLGFLVERIERVATRDEVVARRRRAIAERAAEALLLHAASSNTSRGISG